MNKKQKILKEIIKLKKEIHRDYKNISEMFFEVINDLDGYLDYVARNLEENNHAQVKSAY